MSLKKIILVLFLLLVKGCMPYQSTIDEYMLAAPRVRLGMTKAEVLAILQPSQRHLDNLDKKESEMYEENGVLVEIVYFRSGLQDDGLTTDDEFTPYVFKDGKLTAKGWEILGGPKTQGQVVPQTTIYKTKIIN